jgi:hypothetical protein
MNRSSTKQFAIAAALTALGSAALASPTSEWRYIGDFQPAASNAGLASGGFQNANGLGTNFDASSWNGNGTGSSALTLDAQTSAASADASAAATDERRRALSSSSDSPAVGSTASVELTLWNFVNSIRAQQAGNPFVQLQTAASNIDWTINSVPAPVPLPPAAWLFAGGLAALAIGRVVARAKTSRGDARGLAAA